MRELVILVFLVSTLYADSDLEYKCLEDQDSNANDAAVKFINDRRRHGYKFKFVSLDSRTAKEKADPCEVVLRITLEETVCHIVNPKPLDQCKVRSESETKVTAKCNVTISSIEGKAAVKNYICDTEPGSHQLLVKICPDCPALLPLNDPKGLESVKAALEEYNKISNHTSYFKMLEVGRIKTQWMFMGQSIFAQFAIAETDCPNKEASQNREACKALCGEKARYGFCKSTKIGKNNPVVECEIYEAQNSTRPVQSRDCPPSHHHHHHHHHHHPGHHLDHAHPHRLDHGGHKDKTPDQKGRPEHMGHGHKEKPSDDKGRPEHDEKDRVGCLQRPLILLESGPEGHHEFSCLGLVKINPSIYPICPFPPRGLCRGPPKLLPRAEPPAAQ